MNFLAFWITAMLILGSTSAEEEKPSDNQLLTVEDKVEGRACYDCNAGVDAHEAVEHVQVQYGGHGGDGNVGWWGFGFGGLGLIVIPIIGLNIAIVILLAIILKHLVKITEHLGYVEEEPIYQPVYTGYTTYQGYDHGGAANAYGGGAAYGGSGSGGGYKKRASTEGRNMADASTVNFLSSIVGGALDKYSKIDIEE
ncbi:uncharacterized protein [Palaemon carinicauda]|uniref:uncharacterized protein n=1 Tax=Palaemon carinicauda TaxID=392227 RepID=UPI0035B5AC66